LKRFSTSELPKGISGITERQKYRFFVRPITEVKFLGKFSEKKENRRDFIEKLKQSVRHRFFVSDLNRKEFYVNLMTSIGGFDSIMDDADLVHENKFRWLGQGLFSFGEKVDWHFDFKSGKRWPLSFYTKIGAFDGRDHSDIRIPWELSRFHQAVWLGRAYWISHSEVHAEKFRGIVLDWLDCNPAGHGVNWVNPVEVSIRAVNLIVGLMYFIGSRSLDDDFVMRLACSLYDHGVYLEHNLASRNPTRKNFLQGDDLHVSNLVGLLFLGFFFSDAEFGNRWTAFARNELELEIQNLVYEDGTCKEGSLSRQRFAAELFTISFVVLKLNGFSVPKPFLERLEKMFNLLSAAAAHDGKVPMFGELKECRVFKLKSEADPNDCSDLLAAGAVIFDRADFKHAAKSFSDLALLLLGTEGFERFSSLDAAGLTKSIIFKEGGLAFLRTEKDFCAFNFGGTGGDSRSHNSLLSFTISGKHPFIVERSEYGDGPDKWSRTEPKSIYSHNTVSVDGKEPLVSTRQRFGRKRASLSELLNWSSNDEQDVVEARSRTYEYLKDPVVHDRKITFNKRQRTFLVEDTFSGRGIHQIEMMLHFSPQVKVIEAEHNYLALEGEEFALIKFRHPFIVEDWKHSSGYGIIQEAKSARVKISSEIPLKIETFIFIMSNLDDIHHILNRLK
jgi:hypothetical protein